jgi:cytoskeletal protein CcmA (bactofilin family)
MLAKRAKTAISGDEGPLDTLIGLGTSFEGTLKADNGVQIEGTFKGELFCSGRLTITASANVRADIEGMDVYINGIVRGTVCAERIVLDREGRLVGDIYTQTLSISEGALFSGSSAPLEEGTRDEKNGRRPEERLVSS